MDPELGKQLENQLLTTNYLIRFALRHARLELPAEHRAGIRSFWESTLYASFFRDGEQVQPGATQWVRQLGFA